MPLYRVPPAAVQSAAAGQPPALVACRCCPGGQSRSSRFRRYPSDMDDAGWAVCEPLLPAPAWLAGKGGRPSAYCMRDIVDAIRHLTHNGPVWRALPADFPPAWTIYYWAAKWQADGSTQSMHDQLRDRIRELAGRERLPSAAIIDSQSVRAAEEVGRTSRGYDAGKKVAGRKRHIAVDVMGLLLTVLVTAASVQTATRRSRCCGTCARPSPRSGWPGPTAATPASSSPGRKRRSSSPSRSSGGPMTCIPSRSCPAGGWSSARWPGSPGTGAPSGTTSSCLQATKP